MMTLMFRKLAASMVIVALGGASAAACSGGSGETTGGATNGAEKPNGGTLDPPPVDDGTGKPSNATNFTCHVAEDCGYWYCECSDGFVVNSELCMNGYCLNASGACSNACKTPLWDHGKWTGIAGGGPGSTNVTSGGRASPPGATGAAVATAVSAAAMGSGDTAARGPGRSASSTERLRRSAGLLLVRLRFRDVSLIT